MHRINKFLASLGHWIKENGSGLLIAIIGVVGAFLGAFYGSTAQLDLWRRDKLYQFEMDVLNKRIDLIRSITRSSAAAQRVSILMQGINQEALLLETKLTQCKSPNLDAQMLAYCAQEVKQIIDLNAANKEISDLQSDYFASVQLARIYFCDKTRSAVTDMQKEQKNWWDDTSGRENIIAAMTSELVCSTHFDAILK
jgi:hypothetical protein